MKLLFLDQSYAPMSTASTAKSTGKKHRMEKRKKKEKKSDIIA